MADENDVLDIEVVELAPAEGTSEPPPPDPATVAEAENADVELNRLLDTLHDNVTALAQLVHRIRAQELYRALGHETFEAYIRSKELRMSRSFIYQLAKVGEVLDKAGVDPDALPATKELQISKLAQISRLPSVDEQRRILETGRISVPTDSGDYEEMPLNEVPVKKLNAHVNERLGKAPKIEPLHDPDPEPGFRGAGQVPGVQNAAAYTASATYSIPQAGEEWREALETLLFELRKLPVDARRRAVDEARRQCEELASETVPF